jgi:hypothetical protein
VVRKEPSEDGRRQQRHEHIEGEVEALAKKQPDLFGENGAIERSVCGLRIYDGGVPVSSGTNPADGRAAARMGPR